MIVLVSGITGMYKTWFLLSIIALVKRFLKLTMPVFAGMGMIKGNLQMQEIIFTI